MQLDAGRLDADIEQYLGMIERQEPVEAVYTGEMLILIQVLREVRRLRAEVEALRAAHQKNTSSDVEETIKTLNNMEK